jgi:hypothetical protein
LEVPVARFDERAGRGAAGRGRSGGGKLAAFVLENATQVAPQVPADEQVGAVMEEFGALAKKNAAPVREFAAVSPENAAPGKNLRR